MNLHKSVYPYTYCILFINCMCLIFKRVFVFLHLQNVSPAGVILECASFSFSKNNNFYLLSHLFIMFSNCLAFPGKRVLALKAAWASWQCAVIFENGFRAHMTFRYHFIFVRVFDIWHHHQGSLAFFFRNRLHNFLHLKHTHWFVLFV